MSNATFSKIKLNGTIYEIVDRNSEAQIAALSAKIDGLGNGNGGTKPTYTWNEIQDKPTLFSGSYNDLTNKPTLFSGNYEDLTNKPSIPSIAGLVTQEQLDAIIARLEALEARPSVDGDTLDFGSEGN